MMKNLAFPIIVVILSLCAVGCNEAPNIAFINTSKLYESFELQKERSLEFESWRRSKASGIDSLELVVNRILSGNLTPSEKSLTESQVLSIATQYKTAQSNFDKESQEVLVKYNEEIWSQLNQYTQDYAKEHGYDLVLGANGMGSIMHAQSYLDITQAVSEFCNNRYKGAK